MKKKLLTALAIAGLAVATGAQAQTPLSYTAGNIFLGFRANAGATGADKSFLVNLGNFSNLTIVGEGASPAQVVDLGTELATVYGNNWYANNTVTWGIFGIHSSKLPIYSSTSDDRINAPITRNTAQSAGAWTAYTGMGANYNQAIANGTYAGGSGILGDGVVTGIGNNTWWKNIDAAADFGVYNSTIEAGVNTDLDFYSTTASAATKLTQYTISSSGVVSAVPEPSTYALFGFAALLLIVAYRRKNAA